MMPKPEQAGSIRTETFFYRRPSRTLPAPVVRCTPGTRRRRRPGLGRDRTCWTWVIALDRFKRGPALGAVTLLCTARSHFSSAGSTFRLDEKASRWPRSEEHTSELQSQFHLVCRL